MLYMTSVRPGFLVKRVVLCLYLEFSRLIVVRIQVLKEIQLFGERETLALAVHNKEGASKTPRQQPEVTFNCGWGSSK